MHIHLRCYIRLPAGTGLQPKARVRVAVEEVGPADAPSCPVATADFPAAASEQTLGPFELDVDLASSRGEYALRIHVDQLGEGQITPGDLVSTARHAVPTSTSEVELEIPVAPVAEPP